MINNDLEIAFHMYWSSKVVPPLYKLSNSSDSDFLYVSVDPWVSNHFYKMTSSMVTEVMFADTILMTH